MILKIVPYEDELIPAVKDLNVRLSAGGSEFQFPEGSRSPLFPSGEGAPITQEYFVAMEVGDGQTARGGYILKSQGAWLLDEESVVGNYQLPLSEGSVDPRHGMVGVQLLIDALKRRPMLYSLGMGGLDRPLPRMLERLKWQVELVPFYFSVLNGPAFLRNVSVMQKDARTRALGRLLRWSGVAALASLAYRPANRRYLKSKLSARGSSARTVPGFTPDWADPIWLEARRGYQLILNRDAAALSALYPGTDARFLRLRIERGDQVLGWAVLLCTQMEGHKQFGDLKVGTMVDTLALPGCELDVVAHSALKLAELGAELIVTNQSHSAWTSALRSCHFLRGPSNYGVALSPKLAAGVELGLAHFTRGDGDGPINL